VAGWHPRSQTFDVDLDGTPERCHVVDVGPRDGPALVLLHGIAVSSWAWRKNLEPLAARGVRAIAICHRGHGWSGRGNGSHHLTALSRFVLGALDRLEVPRATFVGNSLGGAVSLWTALHAPERVERLVLINPASHLSQLPWPALGAIAALGPVYRALFGPALLRIPLAAIAYRGLRIDREYMAGFWAPFKIPGSLEALRATARALPAAIAALDARLHEIAHPTLVIWGERDHLLPVQGAHRLLRHIPHARLVLVPGVGHCPHEEDPERTNLLIADAVGR
jgi:pimeloyl-ACP methyl ester carboxylesterase